MKLIRIYDEGNSNILECVSFFPYLSGLMVAAFDENISCVRKPSEVARKPSWIVCIFSPFKVSVNNEKIQIPPKICCNY